MTDSFQNQAAKEAEVIAAYRWVLGREPENAEKVAGHIDRNATNTQVRLSFLRSPEFSRALDRLGIISDRTQQAVSRVARVVNTERVLFIHIPKTAGSSLYQAFEAALPADQLCPIRQNTLLTRPMIELGQHHTFFGHYDARMIDLLPGTPCVLTMLRDPHERLISLYRYLRAHTAERVKVESLALADLARQHNLKDFLVAARRRAPATVDNTYVRTFGGALPVRRWEDQAEHAWLSDQPADPLVMLPAARTTLDRCAAVGILECLDESIALFNRALQERQGWTLTLAQRTQVTDTLAASSTGFEAVIPRSDLQQEVDQARDLLDELTTGDRQLYAIYRAQLEQPPRTATPLDG